MSQDNRKKIASVAKLIEVRKLRKKLDFFILYSRTLEKKVEVLSREVLRLKEILGDE